MDQVVEENDKKKPGLDIDQPNNSHIQLHIPWLSMLASLVLIGFLVISSDQQFLSYYKLSVSWLNPQSKIIYIILLGLIYLLDLRFFLNHRNRVKFHIDTLERQINLLSKSKKKQQQRANTYSDHSEKLKTFISDKLLEYMEYDEKFIHFKGIASEVRHNGVISYDKVITALNKAIEQQKFLALYEQNNTDDTQPDQHTINALTDYQSALDAMRYLWDLLDLSTADNMALHIGNQLIECEEHYYQLQLDSKKTLDITQSIPISPTFNPQMAILMTFSMLLDETEIRNLIALARINETILEKPFIFENDQFYINLSPTPVLLGNHNHIILLLENLIKNAQFFVRKNRYKQFSDRIVIRLLNNGNTAGFSIYNRGPQIKPEEVEEIFKLGFSTRKNKQHHGKGLGLFFANEIVRGYQGTISANNINNVETEYRLNLKLASGETISYSLNCHYLDFKMKIKQENQTEWLNELLIQPDIPIESMTISTISDGSDHTVEHDSGPISATDKFEWIEPTDNRRSQWMIQLKPYKNIHKLTFRPLDITGVCFDIKIPTAKSHLEAD